MDLLHRLGVADRITALGVEVRRGKAHGGGRVLGEISFGDAGSSRGAALYATKYEIERAMEEHLLALAPGRIVRQSRIESLTQQRERIRVGGELGIPGVSELTTDFVVGTDGPDSAACFRGGFTLQDQPPDDHFVMGDFDETPDLNGEARIVLDGQGFMESYPAPGGLRRWVLQTPSLMARPDANALIQAIRERARVDVRAAASRFVAAFRVHHYVADSFTRGRILVAGDTAHSMSPIGGQGLNEGWRDAADVAGAMHQIIKNGGAVDAGLKAYGEKARARALRAVQRQALFLDIGRRGWSSVVKRAGLRLGLNPPRGNPAEAFFLQEGTTSRID
jgi:2-polyprenyl-6-methoxyphenol hydroxylase-like FAD-dependent oxidoreductase